MHIPKHAVKQIAMHIPHSHALSGGGEKALSHSQSLASTRSLLHASTYCRQMQLCTCILAHSWGLTYVSNRIEAPTTYDCIRHRTHFSGTSMGIHKLYYPRGILAASTSMQASPLSLMLGNKLWPTRDSTVFFSMLNNPYNIHANKWKHHATRHTVI